MILDYDTRPDASFDEKIRSLRDSIQLALNELESYAEGQKTKGNAETALRIARQALAAATGGAEPATTLPLMDGTAAIGTDTKYARGDHRHPTDTSRASASDLSALTTTVSGKVDKVTGKGLSTEDYTSAEKTKLAGIATGAEVNVQADWNQTDSTADDYIKNKPNIPSSTLTIDDIYPIGSIYMSANDVDPSALFSGTIWEQIKERFLFGTGDSEGWGGTKLYPVGATGGETTHTLTESEMPSHTHTFATGGRALAIDTTTAETTSGFTSGGGLWAGNNKRRSAINETGGGQSHNNMPPYLVVSIWKRTA